MPNPVVHWEIGTSDAGKLAEFYKGIFGWHAEEFPGEQPYQMIDAHNEERGINGGIAQSDQSWLTFYIEVDDIDGYLVKVGEQGGRTLVSRTEMGMVTFAQFADPEGHVVGLVEPRKQAE